MTDTTLSDSADTSYPFAPVAPVEAVAHHQRISQERPLTKVQFPYGGEAWAIHRHDVAKRVLTDPRFVREPFKRRERVVPAYIEFPPFLLDTLQFADAPDHTKLRRLVQVAISPRRVQALRDKTTQAAKELLEAMIAGGSPANLVDAYALQLPIIVLSELIGVPKEDREKFIEWADSALSVGAVDHERVRRDFEALYAYLLDLIAQRREDPREDLLSSLAHAHEKDDSLTDAEIMPIAMILLVGGFDNTAAFLSTGVISLLMNAEAKAVLLSDIDGNIATAVEEILRHGQYELGAPMGGGGGTVPMIATEDIELDGIVVAKGEAVYVDPNSVDHDPAVFDHAAHFDLTRTENPHMMLSYGIHSCLGAPLARMELQVGLAELFRRLPDLRLDGEFVRNYDVLTQPITQLPVAW